MIDKVGTGSPAAPAQPNSRSEELKGAAKAFEAVFLRQMIGSMRQASLAKDDLLSGGRAAEQFRDMSDAKLADSMSEGGGFGIAELLLKQFKGLETPRK
jgi:flagellar protein FlgJ